MVDFILISWRCKDPQQLSTKNALEPCQVVKLLSTELFSHGKIVAVSSVSAPESTADITTKTVSSNYA